MLKEGIELYFDEKIEEVLARLDAKREGLTTWQANKRLETYGHNVIAEKKKTTAVQIFLNQFKSLIIWILIIALGISALAGEYIDASVIGVIVILNAIVGFIQEYKAEKAIEALKKLTSLRARVIRDGEEKRIDASEIVPGDILVLDTGDKVPADARLIELSNLETQEGVLTGESTPVSKEIAIIKPNAQVAERKNMVFSSTIITRGHAKAIVTGTGLKTELGKIATMIQEEPEKETNLQKKLAGMAKWIAAATIIICLIVFIAGVLRGNAIIEMFLTSVSLAVAAIPEGLPAVVTIALALGVQRMAKRGALVRRLPSVETLGSTTVICTDKTGTLTFNEMTVKKIYVSGEIVEVTGSGYKPEGKFSHVPKGLDLILGIGSLCNNAKLKHDFTIIGDPTEASLITVAAKHDIIKENLEIKYPRSDEISFDSIRKRMTTVHEVDGKKTVYTKGAPDQIIRICTRIYDNGKIRKITRKDQELIMDRMEEFAGNALRVLAFAYKEDSKTKDYEKDLIFVGLQAMMDPPRINVKEAIAKCKSAGIKTVMITGDHKTTALAVARELGIEGKAITGEELDQIENLEKIVDEIAIYARVNPEHKMRIAEALQKKGHIVAMTGDGVNDAPALKGADIGVCVGSGVDVAKEASDMVLTNDDYSTIVNAVEEGRGIYDNIKKFVGYLLASNLGEVMVLFIATLLGWPLPLIAVQILWINLVTDGLPAIALGVDPVGKDVMNKKPRKTNEKIISKNMILTMLVLGILICAGALFVFYQTYAKFDDLNRARTAAFTTLVILELVKLYVIRSKYKVGIFSNKWLILAVISSFILQMLVVYTGLNFFFETVPLQMSDWILMMSVAVVSFIIAMIANKLIEKITDEKD
jgi:Ca2+-transporting ATPase